MGFLRILLSIAVVIEHSASVFGWRLLPGNAAVEAFFIISGFYMALILNEKYTGAVSNFLFFRNRFLRLFPIYWVVLLITIMISAASYALTKNGLFFWAYLTTPLSGSAYLFLGLINLIMLGQDVTVFMEVQKMAGAFLFTSNFREVPLAASRFLLVPQAWSLSLELMFYLIAPFLLRRSWKPIFIVMMVSLMIRVFILYGVGWDHDPWNRRFFPSEVAFFLLGALAYKIYARVKTDSRFIKYARFVTIVILSISLLYRLLPNFYAKEYVYYLALLISLPFLFEATRNFRFDRIIGEYSYPVYLTHILIVRLLLTFTSLPKYYLGIVTIALSIALSYFLLKWVSEPLERLREIRIRKT
jgi:peptidoglycan/LPS O-acetylase OafA/YrhL